MIYQKKRLLRTLFAFGALLLSGCTARENVSVASLSDNSSSNSSSTNENSSSTNESSSSPVVSKPNSGDYYKVSGDTTTSVFNYKYIALSGETDALSTTGSPKILVLPIELTDYPFSDVFLEDLNTALNAENGTGYWESLHSFYKKSSFGALSPTYTIAEKYVSGLTPKELFAKGTDDLMASSYIFRLALENYKTKTKDSCIQFDSEGDGYIDSVILVYSCPDAQKSSALATIDPNTDLFWAFCYWDYTNDAQPSPTSPIGMTYFWMSYDFLYEESDSPKPDAHTLIHESGHLMGADDYYCYDTITSGKTSYTPSPMGGVAMMDDNVTDHDAFTKLAYDWVKPYVVTGNATINIKPAVDSGDCVLIPAKGTTWNGTAFDEYLLLELYTPTGLNELDSKTKYSYDPLGYTTSGIRLLHVDNRLAKIIGDSSGNITSVAYVSGTPTSLPYSETVAYTIPQSNTPSRRVGEAKSKGYNLVSLIQADYPSNTLQYGKNLGNNGNLFETGDSFDQATYSAFFAKGTTLDNDQEFGYKINFESVTGEGALISFQEI